MLAFISWGVNPEFELRRKAVANSGLRENSGFVTYANMKCFAGNAAL